jgi:hypothetical protein
MEEELPNAQDTHASVPKELLVYEGSNGDNWYLVEDPATGLSTIKHTGNLQSGGSVSFSEVESFLSVGNGPEQQALRTLLRQDHLSTILIAYDIHPNQPSAYQDLARAIQSLGAWWHHLETVWIVRSDKTSKEIRDGLRAHIDADDQLLVVDITRSEAEWAGVNEAGNVWLKGNVKREAIAAYAP